MRLASIWSGTSKEFLSLVFGLGMRRLRSLMCILVQTEGKRSQAIISSVHMFSGFHIVLLAGGQTANCYCTKFNRALICGAFIDYLQISLFAEDCRSTFKDLWNKGHYGPV